MKYSAVMLLIAGSVFAHTIEPREVIAYLNSQQVRDACGVTRAAQVDGRPDLLLIEISGKWFQLPPERRERLAREWRDLWRHSVKSRRVSIIDAKSRPVVHYLPDGSVTVEENR